MIISCQEPKHFGNLKMDIESFDYNFDVEAFYAFNGNNDGSITADADASIKKIILELKPIEITNYKVAPKRRNDTLRTIIGKEYALRIWNPSDSVAHYGNYYFAKIDMLQSLNKDLIGVACTDIEGDEDKAKELRDYIVLKEGKPHEKEVNLVYNCRIYTWQKEDRIIALTVRYNEIVKAPFLSDEMTDLERESYAPQTVQVRLFSINNKYKDLALNNLYRGDWMYMQYNDKNPH